MFWVQCYFFLDCPPLLVSKLFDTMFKCGFDLNAKDHHGWTPIHVAAAAGNVAAVSKLMQYKVQIFAQDFVIFSLLHS